MNKKGFTLVELLSVILIMSLILAIAVPSIFAVSNRMKEKSLNSKIELIEKAAVVYAQSNSNAIKNEIGVTCNRNISGKCECDETNTNKKDCKYIYTMTLEDLIAAGAYDAESENANECKVSDPTDKEFCLEDGEITIKLDDDYKNATAEYNYNNPNKD